MFPVRQVCRDRRGFAIAHADGRRTTGNQHERASDRVPDRVGKFHRSAPQMSRTTTSNSDGDLFALAAMIPRKIKEMADAINNLDFSKAADDPRAIRSIAIRNDGTGEILDRSALTLIPT